MDTEFYTRITMKSNYPTKNMFKVELKILEIAIVQIFYGSNTLCMHDYGTFSSILNIITIILERFFYTLSLKPLYKIIFTHVRIYQTGDFYKVHFSFFIQAKSTLPQNILLVYI